MIFFSSISLHSNWLSVALLDIGLGLGLTLTLMNNLINYYYVISNTQLMHTKCFH